MNRLPGILRLLVLDFNLAFGILRCWAIKLPLRRQPILFLLFFITAISALVNCYFMAWGIVRENVGPPSALVRPMFLFFRGELSYQKWIEKKV
jgi:hypothetical protein